MVDKTAHTHRRVAALAIHHIDWQRRPFIGRQDPAQLPAAQRPVQRVAQATHHARPLHGGIDCALYRGATQPRTRLEQIVWEIPMHVLGTGDQPMLLELARVPGLAVA